MRQVTVGLILILVAGWAGKADARDTSIENFPRDVWDLAFVWMEPIKQVARETRRFDPVSGLWFGLLEGSVKSVERTASLLLSDTNGESPGKGAKPGQPLLRYSF